MVCSLASRLKAEAHRRRQIQYEPQFDTLTDVVKEARRNLRSSNAAERAAARNVIRMSRRAIPEIKRGWNEVSQSTRGIQRTVARAGAGGDLLGQATLQAASAAGRTASVLKGVELAENRGRAVQARAGAIANQRSNRAEFRETQADVQGKRSALTREAGQFELSELQKMRDERRQMRQENRRIQIAENADQRAAARDAAERKHHTGPYERPGKDGADGGPSIGQLKDSKGIVQSVREAANAIKLLKRTFPKNPTSTQIRTLLTGSKTEGNPFGGHSQLSTNAAIDLVSDGRVTRTTARRLLDAGALERDIRKLKIGRELAEGTGLSGFVNRQSNTVADVFR